MSTLKAIQNERGHWEKDFGSVKQHTPADCPKCLKATIDRLVLALENARDVVHRTHCPTPGFPSKCWKECEEAMDAMLEAGWMPMEEKR